MKWSIEQVPDAPRVGVVTYLAMRHTETDPDGVPELVRVVMAWPAEHIHAAGLRARAGQVVDPEASAWLAISDHIDDTLAAASTDREATP